MDVGINTRISMSVLVLSPSWTPGKKTMLLYVCNETRRGPRLLLSGARMIEGASSCLSPTCHNAYCRNTSGLCTRGHLDPMQEDLEPAAQLLRVVKHANLLERRLPFTSPKSAKWPWPVRALRVKAALSDASARLEHEPQAQNVRYGHRALHGRGLREPRPVQGLHLDLRI